MFLFSFADVSFDGIILLPACFQSAYIMFLKYKKAETQEIFSFKRICIVL